MMRMIFSTVRAPQEPAFTVESLAISATGRPSMVAVPVTTPSAGRPLGQHVGERAVLGEAARVDQQRDPLPGEQLALRGRLLVIPLGAARRDPGPDLAKVGMAGARLVLLRCLLLSTVASVRKRCPGGGSGWPSRPGTRSVRCAD